MSFAGINATVLQKNNDQFFCDPCGNYGKTMNIPCGSNAALAQPGTSWAVPVKTEYVQGFRYAIQDDAPTFDSIQVFKLTNIQNGDFYWVVGTQATYFTECAACCDASPAPSMISTVGDISAEQYACTTDGTNYDAFFAVETLTSGRYVSTVSVDGTQLTPHQSYATGSTSLANLITYLNANYASAGTWSNPVANTVRLRTTTGKWIGFIACIHTS